MILTTTEFNINRDKVLKTFARLWNNDKIASVWKSARKDKKADAKLMWLFVWALDTYEHSNDVDNYITEAQLHTIFKKTNSIQ